MIKLCDKNTFDKILARTIQVFKNNEVYICVSICNVEMTSQSISTGGFPSSNPHQLIKPKYSEAFQYS